jgi:hypothetical protein
MEDAMKFLLVGFGIGIVLGSSSVGQQVSTEKSLEKSFVQGGNIRLMLSSGDYAIRGGNSDHILVRWHAENPEHVKDINNIRVDINVSGTTATVRTAGPTKHARITIELPAQSHLSLRVRAGDVRIAGIEGNKDIHMTAGDLRVDLIPTSYSLVHASVKFGDLRASPLGISKDGIGNSLDWTGAGKYTLHASLFAGDLTLSQQRLP